MASSARKESLSCVGFAAIRAFYGAFLADSFACGVVGCRIERRRGRRGAFDASAGFLAEFGRNGQESSGNEQKSDFLAGNSLTRGIIFGTSKTGKMTGFRGPLICGCSGFSSGSGPLCKRVQDGKQIGSSIWTSGNAYSVEVRRSENEMLCAGGNQLAGIKAALAGSR